MQTTTHTGRVKLIKQSGGYGFIARADGAGDVFFHCTECEASFDSSLLDRRVEFEIGKSRDGRPVAVRVRVVQ